MRVLSGRYELLEPLGRGGMGVVHRAHDRELDRVVAVKVLPVEMLRSADSRARFRREARAAAGLAHPNIAVVYDIGEDSGGEEPVPYLVMELVEGETLADLLRREPPTPSEAGQVVLAVLEALEHSHGREVVHRDIKPANIMVRRSGGRMTVKVMDFGIAKLLSETATRLTATGMLIGTPSYMSPEQADGKPADVRSDLYSLGCVLYEMLTGRPPFTGDSASVVLFQHLHKAFEPPSSLNAVLAPFWDGILATALAKAPQERYPDAVSMRRAVEVGMAGVAMPGAPTDALPAVSPAPAATIPTAPSRRPVLTRRLLMTGLGTASLALALAPSYSWLTREKPPRVRSRRLTGHTDIVTSVAFSPDGTILASGGWDHMVRLWDPVKHEPLGHPLIGHTSTVDSLAFSPDGTILASGSNDQTAQLWDVAGNAPFGKALSGHGHSVRALAFSPDGKTLLTGSEDGLGKDTGTVRWWDVDSRRLLERRFITNAGSVWAVAISPDGKLFATGGVGGRLESVTPVMLWDMRERSLLDRLEGHTSHITTVAFSPDGKTLASGGLDGAVLLWDVDSRTPLGDPVDGHHAGRIASVAFSPDSGTLAIGGNDTVWLWDVVARAPIGQPLTGHTDMVNSVAFSPDGKTLASGSSDKTVRLWQVADAASKPTPQ